MNTNCLECGYPLSGTEKACPECGCPITFTDENIKGDAIDLRLHEDFARFYQGFFLFRATYIDVLTSSPEDASRVNIINELWLAWNITVRLILWISLMLIPLSILFCTIIFIPYSISLAERWLADLSIKYWLPLSKLLNRLHQRYWISMSQAVKSKSLDI